MPIGGDRRNRVTAGYTRSCTVTIFRINPNLTITEQPIADGQFCVIVDDFLLEPRDIIAYAREHAGEFERQLQGYPGVLMDIGNRRLSEIDQFIRSQMSRRFSFCRGNMHHSAHISMTTLRPDELNWGQRYCHTDPQTEPGRLNFAALLYLFEDEALGGTSFYRWKEEALLQRAAAIGATDGAGALAFLQQHFEMFRAPATYMTGSNEVAELLHVVPARFNRLVFYSGDLPHSAYIREPQLLSDDVRTGRLTLNYFASVVPKGA